VNNLRLVIDSLFTVVPDRCHGNEITILCPVCGDKTGNRSINLSSGKTNCWRCGNGGPFLKWAQRLGHAITEEDIGELIDLDKAEPFLDGVEDQSNKVVPVYSVDVKLPSGFVPIKNEPESAYVKWIGKMAVRKHLSLKDFIKAGVGFTRKGIWEPFAIFPIMEWDRLVYYQGRTYNEEPGEPTKKFPSREKVPYGSRYWIYNIDATRDKSITKIIIVESILNVLSLKAEIKRLGIEGVAPVAIFKHAISREQAAKLSPLLHIEEFCLMFDEDATGAAWKAAARIPAIPVEKFTLVEMPKGIDANDNAELAMKLYSRRKEANRLSHLEWETNNLRSSSLKHEHP